MDRPWIHEEFECSFCGRKTKIGSFWHGKDVVVICSDCLRNSTVLGVLLGDGIYEIIKTWHMDKGFERDNRIRQLIKDITTHTELELFRALTWQLVRD